MSLLFALFLVVHGGIHIGYLCSRSWPFQAGDPWLVTSFGASADTVGSVAAVLVLMAFFAFLLAGLAVAGIVVPRAVWAPLIVLGSVASAIVLVVYITLGTVPGVVVDALLVWAVLVAGWRPTPFFGRERARHDDRPRAIGAH